MILGEEFFRLPKTACDSSNETRDGIGHCSTPEFEFLPQVSRPILGPMSLSGI